MSERIRLVVRALNGEPVSKLAREFEVSRKTAHKWIRVYRETGVLQELKDRSRRPLHSPGQTSVEVEDRVVALRAKHGWGGGKLSKMLKGEGVVIPAGTVDRIIRRRELPKVESSNRPAVTRFERTVPNELWQMDHKGAYKLADGRICTPLSMLDDHSRFVVGLHGVETTAHEPTESSVRATFEQYGLPRAMLFDHGVPWWSATSGHGLTRLSVMLIEYGISLIYSGVAHPQTQGKVERFHRTLKQRLQHRGIPASLAQFQVALAEVREEYNNVRPHEALGMEVPSARYRSSDRVYRSRPEPWEYPVGACMRTISSVGLVTHKGQRYFVSHALAGKAVRCHPFANRLLVSFRHMLIREIDLETGVSTPVTKPYEDA